MLSLFAYDIETHLIQPGLPTPPMVCGAVDGGGHPVLLAKEDALDALEQALTSGRPIGGSNVCYDLAISAVERPRLMPLIFQAFERGRVVDTHVLEALHDNARGLLFREANGAPFFAYKLLMLENRYLSIDRTAQKENGWRFRYAELDGVPVEQYPPEAVEYPRADAHNEREILLMQLADGRENVHCLPAEMRAAWFLRLSSIWGLRTDPVMVEKVAGQIRTEHEESRRRFFAEGITRVRPCTKKAGAHETGDDITAEWLEQARALIPAECSWRMRRFEDLDAAKKAIAAGRPIRFAEDKARLRELVVEAYQGMPPETAGGATRGPETSTSRDTLVESGSDLLESYGESGPNEKLFSTYLSVLEQGTTVPICPEVNTFVATQRCSYREPNLQQLPRKGDIRECFKAREGWLYSSADYGTLELCTLAQVCLWLFGSSRMAEALNAGQDLHTRLAARIMGIGYEEALALKDAGDPTLKAMRQTSKPINFGLPGLMGPPKLVATARKDGVRFCELAGVGPSCSAHQRLTQYKGRAIAPTCCECLTLAVKYSKLWREEWPEMVEYHECTVAQAEECDRGTPLVSFGSGMLRLEPNPNAVSNHFFQNLAAQGAKHAGWLLAKESYTDESSVLFGNYRTAVFVHDETFAEVREEAAHECALRQSEVMVAGMKEFVPDVRITAEPALCRRWFKGAEKTFDKGGRLKPWWPKKWEWEPDQEIMRADNER